MRPSSTTLLLSLLAINACAGDKSSDGDDTAAAAGSVSGATPAAADADADALPAGWQAAADANGDTYWYSDTGETSWTRPA